MNDNKDIVWDDEKKAPEKEIQWDDEKSLAAQQIENAPVLGKIASALAGVESGLSLGLSPAIHGAGDVWERLKGSPNEPDRRKGLGVGEQLSLYASDVKPSNLLETYRKSRDERQKLLDAAKEANPKTFFGGEVGSSLALPLPGATGGKLASRLGKYALTGGVVGGASGFGHSKGDLTKGEVGQVAKDTAIGTGLGVGLGVAGGAVGEVASNAANRILDKARLSKQVETAANKELGIGTSKSQLETLHHRATEESPEVAGLAQDKLTSHSFANDADVGPGLRSSVQDAIAAEKTGIPQALKTTGKNIVGGAGKGALYGAGIGTLGKIGGVGEEVGRLAGGSFVGNAAQSGFDKLSNPLVAGSIGAGLGGLHGAGKSLEDPAVQRSLLRLLGQAGRSAPAQEDEVRSAAESLYKKYFSGE